MLYSQSIISPLDLTLDIKNPRFLSTQPTQEKAIEYLLQYARVIDLAKQIITAGGLYPGERIVVYCDNNKYIVLEGNRRVCACQLLLDPSRIPKQYSFNFPVASQLVKSSIEKINIDVIDSRKEADSFLTARHIGGVERWDPLAKMKFFEDKFSAGLSLDDIASLSNYPKNEIKNDISQYYLFNSALNLSCWTKEQRENELNLFTIEIDKFLRVFNTKGAKSTFKLSFNPYTLQPVSKLPGDLFEKILERIMYCAFITTDPNEKIDTRTKNWKYVPGILDILSSQYPEDDDSSSSDSKEEENKASTDNDQKFESTDKESESAKSNGDQINNDQEKSDLDSKKNDQGKTQQPIFFDSLTWSGVDQSLLVNQGLLNIASEIKRFSVGKTPPYKSYPIAATILLRSLLEQTLKYYLNKTDPTGFQNISSKDPSLGKLLNYFRGNNRYKSLIPDTNMQRVFSSLFDNDAVKDFLDLTVHHPNYVSPTYIHLESYAKSGLLALIKYLLDSE